MKKIFTFLLLLTSYCGFAQSIVISQVYGGGGNSGATYTNDFVELFNPTSSAINIKDWSVQYNSATSTTTKWYKTILPNVSIAPGQYYLIQEAVGAAGTVALPTPDVIGTIGLAGGSGKLILTNDTADYSIASPTGANIIDKFGYGPTSTSFEGTPTAILTNSTAALRNNAGCTDANNNSTDFTIGAPAPRNTATAIHLCSPSVTPSLTAGVFTNFGSVTVGQSSASQNYSLSGANLTGAPGNITVTAPTDFQVSKDNITWASSVTIAYSAATLSSTLVYVRFTPTTAGVKSATVSNAGGGLVSALTVAVAGTATAPVTPTLVAGALTAFGSNCINVATAANSFTLNGTALSNATITVAALSGYTYATTLGGTYTSSLSLTQSGGTYAQTIFVKFTPTANSTYSGNIAITGGGATAINVAASGAGANNAPTLVTGAVSGILLTSASVVSGSISVNGCSAITAYGIEYSTVNGFATGTGIKVAGTNLSGTSFSVAITGLVSGTTYYYKAYATNGGGTGYGVQSNFTTQSPVINATSLAPFGSVCITATSAAGSFTLSSAALTSTNVIVGPLNGYIFSTTLGGTYTSTLNLPQVGGAYSQVIYVKFSPVAVQNYNGNIPVAGGGALPINVAVAGSASNTPPTVSTGAASFVNLNSATIVGSITDFGCTTITASGFEYSSIKGFAAGNGTKVTTTAVGNNLSATLTSLVPASTYYYKAYAVNNGGIAYGTQQSFKTDSLKDNFIIYATPLMQGGVLHYSLTNVKPSHYQIYILNNAGQVVYKKEMIQQLNFIDDKISIPSNFQTGYYTLQIANYEFSRSKIFLIL